MGDEGLAESQLYLNEREKLIDAARESARTFDKAVLAFGSAVFGFSIAFVKDLAPIAAPDTLKWLGASWLLFSLGLLERVSKISPESNPKASEVEEGAVVGEEMLMTHQQAAKLPAPGIGSLHDPTALVAPQFAFVFI